MPKIGGLDPRTTGTALTPLQTHPGLQRSVWITLYLRNGSPTDQKNHPRTVKRGLLLYWEP